jgi:predicted transcriptional regulator of viral defense system
MKFDEFIKIVEDLPIIEIKVLKMKTMHLNILRVQISRWQKSGKLLQLKRGIYVLAPRYRKVEIYEPYVASLLKNPSYISLEKALEFHSLIPEAVSVYTSVTPKRPARFVSEVGVFDYKHIKPSLFWGYTSISVNKQTAFMASSEKALLDLIYLKGMKISLEYLEGLRLQNVEKINLDKLFNYAKKFKKPGMLTATKVIKKYIDFYKSEEKEL